MLETPKKFKKIKTERDNVVSYGGLAVSNSKPQTRFVCLFVLNHQLTEYIIETAKSSHNTYLNIYCVYKDY